MRFHEKWIEWMKLCLQIVHYYIMANGENVGNISPERGLRQGDSLLSYPFILCTQGLPALFKKYELRGNIYGVKVCRNVSTLTHLLFVDIFSYFAGQMKKKQIPLNKIFDMYGTTSK